jgi:hypothetical protein
MENKSIFKKEIKKEYEILVVDNGMIQEKGITGAAMVIPGAYYSHN